MLFVFIPVLFLPACKIIPNNETYTSCVYNGSIAIEQRGLKEVGIMKSQDESSKVTAQELSETQVMLPNVAYLPKKKSQFPLMLYYNGQCLGNISLRRC